MAVGRHISVNGMNPSGGYQEPSIVNAQILDHRIGHYVGPNRVAFKYLDFKKDVDLNVHVKAFNYAVKANAKNSKENIINAFSYMRRNIASDWCQNYMLEFPNYIFLEFTQ